MNNLEGGSNLDAHVSSLIIGYLDAANVDERNMLREITSFKYTEIHNHCILCWIPLQVNMTFDENLCLVCHGLNGCRRPFCHNQRLTFKKCVTCNLSVCPDTCSGECTICKRLFCNHCASLCVICQDMLCTSHMKSCVECGVLCCTKVACMMSCDTCNAMLCDPCQVGGHHTCKERSTAKFPLFQ